MKKIAVNPIIVVFVVTVALLVSGYLLQTSAVQHSAGNAQDRIIRGRVVSTYGPVKNARVRIAGDEKYALTDRQGSYELVTAHRTGQQLMVTAGKEGWFNNGQVADRSGSVREIGRASCRERVYVLV